MSYGCIMGEGNHRIVTGIAILLCSLIPISYQADHKLTPNGTLSSTWNSTSSSHEQPQFGHNLAEGFSHAVSALFLVIIIVAVSCNSLLIATIIAVRKLHSYMHVFIVNLALSNLITALGTIPFDVEFMLRRCFVHGKIMCGIMQITFLISLPSSVMSLLLLTAERFISVVFPYRVHVIITKKTVVLSVVLTWVYVLLVALFPIMYNGNAILIFSGYCFLMFPLAYQMFQVIVNFLLPTIIICGINTILFRIAHKHANKMSFFTDKRSKPKSLSSDSDEDVVNEQKSRKHKRPTIRVSSVRMQALSRNMKAIKRIALLVGVFLVCWTSYIIVVATNYICRCHSRELTWLANVINYSSTAINPVLYGLLNKNIRRELLRKMNRLLKPCLPSVRERGLTDSSIGSDITCKLYDLNSR